MKRGLFLVTLLACAASARGQPQEQHLIASPNPTVEESKTSAIEPAKVSASKAHPAAATTAAPMKKATRPKRRRKSRQ